jgi:N-methylhydantoinase B
MNRSRFRPWGVDGGHPGHLGGAVLNPGTPGELAIAKITVLEMKRGDLIRLVTPSGGGFGDPLQREPERVLRDVVGGWLTEQAAERDYGVVIRDGVADAAATTAARQTRAGPRASGRSFAMGPERAGYDRIWPPTLRGWLASQVLAVRKNLRPHLLAAVRDRLTGAGAPVDQRLLQQVLAEEHRKLIGPDRGSSATEQGESIAEPSLSVQH